MYLILGIDVGINMAFALLDFNCNIIDVISCRKNEIQHVLTNITETGKICIISCDKSYIPKNVKKIASMLGAKVIVPKENLSKTKKRKFVKYVLRKNKKKDMKLNVHEKDALASAVFAYKNFSSTVKKIKDKLIKWDMMDAYETAIGMMIRKKGFRISNIIH